MQNVKFNSIVEFFDYLPEDERILTLVLRDLILETLPDCHEKLSFQVPFFSMNRSICFLWPGSILWGKKRIYDGVRFGFNYANQIDPQEHILRRDKRKSVGYLDLVDVEKIPVDAIKDLLLRSRELDAAFKKSKR